MLRLGFAVGVLAVAGMVAAAPSDLDADLRVFLTRDLKFSAGDLADLEHGRIVKQTLGTTAPGEVAAVGAMRIHARKEQLIAAYRNISQFKKGQQVLQIGRFANPPSLNDLDPLTITRTDVNARACRVGDCDVRLPAGAILRFQREIDWSSPDADSYAASLFKQIVFEHVRAYVSGGPGCITEYDDGRRPIRPVEDFAGLLNSSPYLGAVLPGLAGHFESFPARRLAGADDFLYWSKENLGLTPFISVTHVTMAPVTPHEYVIASRDVYSSRYIDASLALTIVSDAVDDGGAFYLIYVNRSRVSALKGAFSKLRRAIVEHRAKDSLEENLGAIRDRFEGA